ncbi:nuclear pore complex protein Nup98-Nup96-like [Galleria mellonella]|uniref:Nuclear pore complex protein Nup98-Nup96-like n=1 Tax=Galleria mellonella TaxID=7137 RepID=A0A6J1WVR2_GALME|nr:nuclear pore complex protein Nup98-Nup96-like [Galleria mellonella]
MLVALYLAVGMVNVLAKVNNYNIYIPKNQNMDIRVRRSVYVNEDTINEVNDKHMKVINEVGMNEVETNNEILKNKVRDYILNAIERYTESNSNINEFENKYRAMQLPENNIKNDELNENIAQINEVENNEKINEVIPNEVTSDYLLRSKRYTEKYGKNNPGLMVMGACFLCVDFGCPKFFTKIGIHCVPNDYNEY